MSSLLHTPNNGVLCHHSVLKIKQQRVFSLDVSSYLASLKNIGLQGRTPHELWIFRHFVYYISDHLNPNKYSTL